VELRSITESIRSANVGADYLEATATAVHPERKSITCEAVTCDGAQCSIKCSPSPPHPSPAGCPAHITRPALTLRRRSEFEVEYDTLVMGVGASVNTFGIKGVRDHCFFLKQIEHAAALRTAIGNTFERANLPGMSEEERIKTLTFVVVGAGPTGIEFTAELRDFIEEDLPKYYPGLLKYVRIRVLEASDRVLMQFKESLQEKAVADVTAPASVPGLAPDYCQVLLQSAVKEVTADDITLNDGTVLPYGIAVWAAGIGPLPVTLDLVKKLPECAENQQARGRLTTDRWLRVAGADGTVLALGDCAFVKDAPLPATAQVAAQQGSYLGRLLSRGYDFSEMVPRKADHPQSSPRSGHLPGPAPAPRPPRARPAPAPRPPRARPAPAPRPPRAPRQSGQGGESECECEHGARGAGWRGRFSFSTWASWPTPAGATRWPRCSSTTRRSPTSRALSAGSPGAQSTLPSRSSPRPRPRPPASARLRPPPPAAVRIRAAC
jgi:NADH dehydrogenase FAD-containing subunit